jgi:HTH-type transcriptional regulator / antitoxin HipB
MPVPVSIRSPDDLGRVARAARKAQGLRQEDVAIAAGVGIRFVSELERGKPSVRLAETLNVLAAVGVRISVEDRG